jgi:hypothetical protein
MYSPRFAGYSSSPGRTAVAVHSLLMSLTWEKSARRDSITFHQQLGIQLNTRIF